MFLQSSKKEVTAEIDSVSLRLVFYDIFTLSWWFDAHWFEDALVFKDNYPFFWPLVPQHLGVGLFHYKPTFYGIVDKEVLIVGLILLASSAILRTAYEGTGWVANYLPMSGAISYRKHH